MSEREPDVLEPEPPAEGGPELDPALADDTYVTDQEPTPDTAAPQDG